jgi:hypothetical protein
VFIINAANILGMQRRLSRTPATSNYQMPKIAIVRKSALETFGLRVHDTLNNKPN